VGVTDALERLEYCFSKISVKKYCADGQTTFDHLYSDQYLMFLWYLSNSLWRRNSNAPAYNKVYLLNKALHGFDCSFSTELPAVFIIIHGVGTVLGKAKYADCLAVYQGCTIGQAHGKYPTLGRGVGLGAGVAVLGDCTLGDTVSVGAGCTLVNTQILANSSVYRNKEGTLKAHKTKANPIAAEYFSGDFLQRPSEA
jgi:serine O-acetyltransferase